MSLVFIPRERFPTAPDPVWSKNSCRVPIVIVQKSSKPIAAVNWSFCRIRLLARGEQKQIVLTLVIPFGVVMSEILIQRQSKRYLL